MADVVACGERLIELGYTTPRLMGWWGASAGGVLVTPVGLRRPDLFAAVVTTVGIVNPTRLAVANNGPNQLAEMGDPNTDDGYKTLAAQDSTPLDRTGKIPAVSFRLALSFTLDGTALHSGAIPQLSKQIARVPRRRFQR